MSASLDKDKPRMPHDDASSRAHISKLTKSLILGQSLIIMALSIWLYKEYLNNAYLKTYLSGVFQGQGSIVALLSISGILAIGFVGILLKAGNIMGEIEHLSSKIQDQTGTAPTAEVSSRMPLLEVVDPHPMDDISRIHGSMSRWKERSKHRDRNS